MFLNILDEPRIILLKKILAASPIPSAYLAGGTALALVLGHRQSIDGFVDSIQVTWLRYPNPLLDEMTISSVVPGLKLASILDIAVMKWAAISDRGSRKDFIDLYFICRNGLTLESLVPFLSKKFPEANINYYHMIKSFSYFDDAEEEGWPVMHQSVDWNDIKSFFIENQKKLMKQLL